MIVFRYFLPLEAQTWIPFTQLRLVCSKFGWNWPSGSGEEDENVKTTTMDNEQINCDRESRHLKKHLFLTSATYMTQIEVFNAYELPI